MTYLAFGALVVCVLFVSPGSARPSSYKDALGDALFSRWRRPFFNPYPSWLTFLKQVYTHRHGADKGDRFDKRPFFNVFPRIEENTDEEET